MEKFYVAAILGKRIKENQLTKEGCFSRLNKFLSMYKERILRPDLILPTGGKRKGNETHSEATLAWSYLVSNGIPESKIVVEIESQNTISNFDLLLKKLEQREIGLSNVEISIISTDYHIDRIKKIKNLMPNADILLRSLEKKVGNCDCWSAPYYYASDNNELKKWKGNLYVASEDLRIFQTNLNAIVKERDSQIYKEVFEMYLKFLSRLKDILVTERPKSSDKQKREQEDEIIDEISPVLKSLEENYNRNLEFFNLGYQEQISSYYNFLKKNHELISIKVDPDESI